MVGTIGSGTGTVHLIEHALAVADSRAALTDLTNAVGAATASAPLGLELTGDRVTAPALQLLLAAAQQLEAAGGFSGFGPCATGTLAALSLHSPERS
ncbi:MAG: hypothetical protein Q7J44_07425 [Pseudotabrizicola sp.]|uniref:hypothetical protein n=1 Tax=Pseudotabrizicola sp. TaxID=2939647 RepID=UPI002716E287|nr:hypothetical protein [Pseudotabrizicola sp.]MDO9638358.1 hypothetical protein [Pseudotabrizicola sp.]